MELKYYDKPWLPAIKGVFLIITGILLILNIVGTIVSLGVIFSFLIAMMAFLLIGTGILYKNATFRVWRIISGVINLGFFVYLVMHVDKGLNLVEARTLISMTTLVWLIYNSLTEFIEAGILVYLKNAFASVFVINGLLSLMFGFFLYKVIINSTPQGIFYIGLIALVVGIVSVLNSYLLSRIKE